MQQLQLQDSSNKSVWVASERPPDQVFCRRELLNARDTARDMPPPDADASIPPEHPAGTVINSRLSSLQIGTDGVPLCRPLSRAWPPILGPGSTHKGAIDRGSASRPPRRETPPEYERGPTTEHIHENRAATIATHESATPSNAPIRNHMNMACYVDDDCTKEQTTRDHRPTAPPHDTSTPTYAAEHIHEKPECHPHDRDSTRHHTPTTGTATPHTPELNPQQAHHETTVQTRQEHQRYP